MNWKVLTGTAKEVETELNKLEKDWYICVMGVSATNELTTVVVQITGSKQILLWLTNDNKNSKLWNGLKQTKDCQK